MQGLTRRGVVLGAMGAAIVAGVAHRVRAEGYESRPMTADEMVGSGGLIVDIRAPEEWAETGVLPEARLVTFADAESFLAAVAPDLADGRPLILICRSGRRSAAAAEALAGRIANPIISVDGGMSAVIAAGTPVVAPQ